MAVFVNEGLVDIARHTLGIDLNISLKAILWTNNITPAVTDTLRTYQICTLPGYADVSLAPNQWIANNRSGQANYVYPLITWSFGAYAGDDVSIYGYAVYNVIKMHVLWADTLVFPYTVPHTGGSLPVSINVQFSNCA